MNKRNTTILAGALLVGAGTAASADPRRELGTAQGFDIALASTITDQARTREIENGIQVLRQTDQENTNEQASVVFTPDGTHAWYFHMRTSPINEGTAMESSPEYNMQLALSYLELGVATDGSFTVQRAAATPYDVWATNNDGDENRNANKPEGYPIMGGKYIVLEYNYRPENENNTDRYAAIFDQQLNRIPIDGQDQVIVMQKNNDDCSGGQDGAGRGMVTLDTPTKTTFVGWDLCNGNNEDAGWLRRSDWTCTGEGPAATCSYERVFDVRLAEEEERSRGRCTVGGADRSFAVCSWTEDDDQPMHEGVWIAGVDITDEGGALGPAAQNRILWKERIQKRTTMLVNGEEREYYAMRANHTREMALQPDGSLQPTNRILYQWGLNRGGNNNDKKGGRTDAVMGAVYELTRAGYTEVAPMTNLQPLLLGFENTHTAVTEAVFGKGDEIKPGFSLVVGDHTGGIASASSLRTIMFDPATKEWKNLGQHSLGRAYDRHLYSNYLGNNPGFQGRNFGHCQLVKNPYAAMNNNNVTFFQACALTGKAAQHTLSSTKGSAFLTIMPVAFTKAAPPPGGNWNEEELPGEDNPTQGDPDEGPGTSVGGCSTSGGSTGLLVGLAFLGLAITRRRK